MNPGINNMSEILPDQSSGRPLGWQRRIFNYLNSIKTKLIASFLIITLTPLIYISYAMLSNATAGLLNVIVNNSLAHARKASIDLNRFVLHQFEIIQLLAKSRPVLERDSESLAPLLREFDKRYFSIEKIQVFDLQGGLLAASNDVPSEHLFDFDAARLEEKPFLLRNSAGSTGRSPVAVVTRLHDQSGAAFGFLLVELNQLQLATIFSESVVGNSTRIYLLDELNRPVIATPGFNAAADLAVMMPRLETHEHGVFAIESAALEKPLLASLLPVIGHGWKVLLLQEQQEVYFLVQTFERNLYWILFLTMLVAVIIALIISQNIALPILQVTRGANELASGRFDVRISVANTDEVGQLASNFNFMADSLAGKMAELKVAYEELQIRAQTIERKNIELDRKVFEIGVLYKRLAHWQ